MKIAIPTRFAHSVGGVETYLECVLPALVSRGHDVVVWHEIDMPSHTASIVGRGVERRLLGSSDSEARAALRDMRGWQPDVVFSQGIARPSVELDMTGLAPYVPVLHAYQGACISGFKTHTFPSPVPCQQALGPSCLLQFHARRCGGWSPLTMVQDYATQTARRDVLRRSTRVVTLSQYMRDECVRQGVQDECVQCVPAFAPPLPHVEHASTTASTGDRRLHLAFAGRMERLKGAQLLLEALALVTPAVLARLHVTMLGDGIERAACERLASGLRTSGAAIDLPGWCSREEWSRVLRHVDLLVVPSVWPEPLGLIGLEAASAGVPALAFDVGGISDWLVDGQTGRLLSTRPSASALARGIEDCLSDPPRLRRWGHAAASAARLRTVDAHVEALEAVLMDAVEQRGVVSAGSPT